MNKIISIPCTRCGKERVISKVWEEKIDSSVIVITETVCPDLECQKKVNTDNKKQRDKYTAIKLKSKQRVMNRKAVKDAKIAKRNAEENE